MKTIGKHILYLIIFVIFAADIACMVKNYPERSIQAVAEGNIDQVAASDKVVGLNQQENHSFFSSQQETMYQSIFLSPPALIISWLIMITLILSLFTHKQPGQKPAILP